LRNPSAKKDAFKDMLLIKDNLFNHSGYTL